MMVIDSNFKIRQFVYLKTDAEQLVRMVTGILVRENGTSYELVCGDSVSWHYAFEISEEKDVVITTSN